MDGLVAPGFEGVRTALATAVGPGDGAAVAAIVGGRPVVDLWAGTVPEESRGAASEWAQATTAAVVARMRSRLNVMDGRKAVRRAG